MEISLDKALKTVATLALCVIAVQIIPISQVQKAKLLCAEYDSANPVVPPRGGGLPELNIGLLLLKGETYGEKVRSHISKVMVPRAKRIQIGYTGIPVSIKKYCEYFKNKA